MTTLRAFLHRLRWRIATWRYREPAEVAEFRTAANREWARRWDDA